MHVTDFHATFVEMASASKSTDKPLDGLDVWSAITQFKPSPRTEIFHNQDPCSQFDEIYGCTGEEYAIRVNQWKLLVGVANDTYYPLPLLMMKTLQTLLSRTPWKGK